jgi:2-oxoglutarate ferredoxin oxidoreductase subunit alpha
LEHRIGGLEKSGQTGDISYDPANHHGMTLARMGRVARIVDDIPALGVQGPDSGDLLVLGWGGTYGALASACERARRNGKQVASAHLRYLNPFPANLGDVLSRYKKVLIPELNTGQLALLVRGRYLVDAVPFSKVSGQPFKIGEIEAKIDELLGLRGPYELQFTRSAGATGG